jgi:hypothetical protein
MQTRKTRCASFTPALLLLLLLVVAETIDCSLPGSSSVLLRFGTAAGWQAQLLTSLLHFICAAAAAFLGGLLSWHKCCLAQPCKQE